MMLRDAREAFPKRCCPGVKWVISHRRRLAINERVQAMGFLAGKLTDDLRISARRQSGMNATQDMITWRDVVLAVVTDRIKTGAYIISS